LEATRSAGNCRLQLQEEEFAYPEGFTTLERNNNEIP